MEYANAAITIGGKIKRSDVAKLAEALADDYVAIDWSDQPGADELADHIAEQAGKHDHLRFCNNEQPWGRYENTEAVCDELGLTYVAECEAGGEWHPLLTLRQPEMGTRKAEVPVFRDGKSIIEEQDLPVVREWSITEIGRGPMIDAEDIQKHLDAGTLADEIALMTAVHKFPWPLEIVEDPPDFAEATRAVAEGGVARTATPLPAIAASAIT